MCRIIFVIEVTKAHTVLADAGSELELRRERGERKGAKLVERKSQKQKPISKKNGLGS